MSTRGPGGGYSLSRTPEEISMAEIILAVDETYDATNCSDGNGGCAGDHQCLTHDLWQELSQEIHRFLNGITLAEMRSKDAVIRVAERQDKKQGEQTLKKMSLES